MRRSSSRRAVMWRRNLIAEKLERRDLLAGDLPFQNQFQRFDVDQDLDIGAFDALLIINYLGRNPDGTLPECNEIGRFFDVNGSGFASALDALQVINRLGLTTPTLAGRLVSDSAPDGETNTDRITNSYSLEFGITNAAASDEVEARVNASDSDPFINIMTLVDPGTLRLGESAIDQIAGGPLGDGDNRFEVRVVGRPEVQDFTVTVDRVAPDITVSVDAIVRETFESLDVRTDERFGTDVTDTNLFELTVSGGPNDGTVVPIASVTEDVLINTAQVNLNEALADQGYRFKVNSPISDIAGNATSVPETHFTVADPTGIGKVSPASGERLVSVTRETIVRFDEQVDPVTITGGGNSLVVPGAPVASDGAPPIHVIANGERLGGRLVVSSTERFATFYYDDPLPSSTEVRVVVDGERIVGRDGLFLDADGNNEPGGVRIADFRTLPIGPIVGTGIFGFVKDSTTDEPIVGATIRVDSLPSKNVVTDASGRFELVDLPAPEVFVHIDGTTATNLPTGYVYPNVGKPFHTTAGQSVQLNMNGEQFDIFLPRLKETDIQALSPTAMTDVGLGDDGKQRLAEIFPEVDPSMFDLFNLSIEPGGAVDDFGNPATQAAIIPVEPDRIPAPLPSFLDPELVVSIQVPGATSFDIPAEITFPNLEGLAPGEKPQIFSFDHDKGEWELVGTGTVSEDGLSIVSDGGVIQAPGWHATQGGAGLSGEGTGVEEDEEEDPVVRIFGEKQLFTAGNQEATITISNNSDVNATVNISFDSISDFATTSFNQSSISLAPRKSEKITITTRDDITVSQSDDPNTTNARIFTGSIHIVVPGEEEPIEEKTILYGLTATEDGRLKFPVPLDEEDPPETEAKSISLVVTGPADQLRFGGSSSITFEPNSVGATFVVPASELLKDTKPTGTLTLETADDPAQRLGTVPINADEVLDLSPFAIRRLSGEITGDIKGLDFGINGEIEVGLAGAPFTPLFKIDGSFIVNQDEFTLNGKVTTNLLQSIPGFGTDVVLAMGTVFTINRPTKEFVLSQLGLDDLGDKQFSVGGMKFKLTDLFIPEDEVGLGVRGSVTLPEQLGNVVISIGADDPTNSVIISTEGVCVKGGSIAFPSQMFTIFGVQANATNLSLEFRKRGIEDGVLRGNRLLLMGNLELRFPNFDPDLRVLASFASPTEMEPELIDLDETLGVAWTFALQEQPDLAGIDSAADEVPPLQEAPAESFIRLEALPDGGLGVDAVGRLSIKELGIPKIGSVIKDAFLTIDTVNNNYFGFARVVTPLKGVGEFTALLGFEGGDFDLVAVGLGDLNDGRGFPIGGSPIFLQSIGGGVKDISMGLDKVDLIAAVELTAGPNEPKLIPAFTLPSFLGGLQFEGADVMKLELGGNVGLTELNLGGRVSIGATENTTLIQGDGSLELNFRQPISRIDAALTALDGALQIRGLNGEDFASLAVNRNYDVTIQGQAVASLPQTLPYGLKWAAGKELASSSAAFKFTNDGISTNDFLAFWGTVEIFNNTVTGRVSATAGLQVFLAAKFPNLITSTKEANTIASGAEGEFTGEMVFEIPSASPYSIFAVEWENASSTAEVVLVDPSGTVFTEDQFDANQSIALLNSSDTSRDVAVAAPDAGNWTLRVVDDIADDLGNVQFLALLDAPLPSVDVTAAFLAAGQVTVDFDTSDASENALVTVYLDSDRNDFNGVILADGLTLEGDGSGSVNVDFDGLGLQPGTYFVYAQIDDPGKPPALSEYFVDGFSIADPTALAAVQNVHAHWHGGNQLEVSWDPLAGAEAYVVQLTDNAGGIGFQQTVDVDSTDTSIVISDASLESPLVSGETYRIAVVGLDTDAVPGSADGLTVATVGIAQSVGPEAGQFAVYAIPGTTYTGQVAFATGDTAELIEGPAGSTVDENTGQFSWDVPADASGFMDVTIKVTPVEGITRFDEFSLLASAVPMGTISAQTFDDANRDGVKAVSEIGTNGITVELVDAVTGDVLLTDVSADIDLDQNSTIDPASESGIVLLENLNPGRYLIRRTDVLGQDQFPVVSDAATTFISLGDRSNALISGTVTLDQDFDGAGDVAQAGVVVGLDIDGNGTTDFETVTQQDDPATASIDETGMYQFEGLLAGVVDVIVTPPIDMIAVGSPTQSVMLDPDQDLPGIDFALQFAPIGDAPSARLFNTDQSVLVFNQIDVGETSADGPGGDLVSVNLELLNLGDVNMILDSVEIADPGSGFALAGIAAGDTVLPEGILDTSSALPFTLTYDPSLGGDIATTLTIATNDPDGPLVIDLIGSAITDGPELMIVTPNNNAGGVAVGTSETRVDFWTLTNIGSQDLTITEINGSLGFTASALPANFPAQPIVISPGSSLSLDLDVAPSQLGLQSGTIQVNSDDVNRPVQSQFVVATGVGASGPEANVGGDFVAVATPALPGSPVLRDITGPDGEYFFILTPIASYEVVIFDPDSGLVAKSLGTTGDSGETTAVNEPAFLASTAPDSDNDTLPDDVEFAIGTSLNNPDTDGDGVGDFAEILQGLDPLNGLLVRTGIVAALPVMGEANEVVVASSPGGPQLAYLATGSHGLAIVDVSDVLNPIVLGQLDLPGDARDVDVDLNLGLAAVASDTGGLHVVDISDPMIPTLAHTVSTAATRTEVFGGIAYIAGGNNLSSVDLVSGEIIQTVTGGSFTDVKRLGSLLYTMEVENSLRVFELDGLAINEQGTLSLADGGGRIFVGDDIAYVPSTDRFLGGFSTVDVTDPANPVLISGTDVVGGNAPGIDVIPNGSGLGIALGDIIGAGGNVTVLDVVDVSDPTNTNIFDDTFRARILLPDAPVGGVIAGGIAFVADGTSGLQVVNYLAFDDQGIPPTISVSLPDLDIDAGTPGMQVLEGTALPLIADVSDDVQVRSVDLLVDGQLVSTDVSFPFDLTTFAPALANGTNTLTLRARATDTGGNVALSNSIVVEVIEDTIAPTIEAISITEGSTVNAGVVPVVVDFSEAIDVSGINSTNFTLTEPLLGTIAPLSVLISPDQTSVRFTYLVPFGGDYQFTIDATSVTDRAQNPLGAADVVTNFTVDAPRPAASPLFPELLVGDLSPVDAVVADFDGDNIPDLATLPPAPGVTQVQISLGNGDGTFSDPVGFDVDLATNPSRVVTGDFNGDQKVDLLISGFTADLSLLLALGDGTFAPQILVPIDPGSQSLTVVDIDEDGVDDILTVVGAGTAADLRVRLGAGDGTFADAQSFRFDRGGFLAIADVNNDENLDALAIASGGISLLPGNGDGTFGASTRDLNVIDVFFSPIASDVNGDDDIDLIIRGLFNVTVLLGAGDGTFGAPTALDVPAGPVVVDDFDSNDTLDVATIQEQSNGAALLTTLSVVLGNGDGTFGDGTAFDVGGFPDRLLSADINLDGNVDLLTAGDTVSGVGNLGFIAGVGDGTFRTQKRFVAGFDPNSPGEQVPGPNSVVIGDANGDQVPDVIGASGGTDEITLLLGNGDGSLQEQVKFPTGARPIAIVADDFSGDNKLDVITANSNSSDISVLLGDGSGNFALPVSFSVGGVPTSLAFAKIDVGDSLDLVVGIGGNQVAVLLGNGDGTFAPVTMFDAGSTSPTSVSFISLADVNNDGTTDILSANRISFGGGSITALIGAGDGTFAAGTLIAEISGVRNAVADDINADGLTDIVATVGGFGTSELVILIGEPGGGFAAPVTIVDKDLQDFVALEDVDGDQNADIIASGRLTGSGDHIYVLLGNGAGSFAPALRFAVGQEPQGLAFGDLNLDGATDIVSAQIGSRDVSVLLNQRPPAVSGGEGESLDSLVIDEGRSFDEQVVDSLLTSEPTWWDPFA